MKEEDKMKTIDRIQTEIEDIQKTLQKDNNDGYLLRPYVRQRLEDRIETLRNEEREIYNSSEN